MRRLLDWFRFSTYLPKLIYLTRLLYSADRQESLQRHHGQPRPTDDAIQPGHVVPHNRGHTIKDGANHRHVPFGIQSQ